jgi:hypothetical protein
VVFAGYLEIPQRSYDQYGHDKQLITGLQANFKVFKGLDQFCRREHINAEKERLVFFNMPPSFTCILKTTCPGHMKKAVYELN